MLLELKKIISREFLWLKQNSGVGGHFENVSLMKNHPIQWVKKTAFHVQSEVVWLANIQYTSSKWLKTLKYVLLGYEDHFRWVGIHDSFSFFFLFFFSPLHFHQFAISEFPCELLQISSCLLYFLCEVQTLTKKQAQVLSYGFTGKITSWKLKKKKDRNV